MSSDSSPQADLHREVQWLKEALQDTREELQTVKARQADQPDKTSAFEALGLSRREALHAVALVGMGMGMGTAANLAMSGQAAAAPTGEIGTSSEQIEKAYIAALHGGGSPIDIEDAITFDHEAVSSATTIGNTTYVYLDTSVAGFTTTIPASLESRGGFLVFIDEGDNVSSNAGTITSANWTVDGQANATFDADQAVYPLVANPNQSDWTSRIFTKTLEVGSLATGSINGENVVKSSTKEYDVQKDGSDASGNINFKTS